MYITRKNSNPEFKKFLFQFSDQIKTTNHNYSCNITHRDIVKEKEMQCNITKLS